MRRSEWILFSTDTIGQAGSAHLVELAAQRMRGWQTSSKPFRKLAQPHADWLRGKSNTHGHTREVLERDGEPLCELLEAFATYAGNHALVAYNQGYHLDEVIRPAWQRLHLPSHGETAGFCLLRLAHRLLDPVPSGSCSLSTLGQFYKLPDNDQECCLKEVLTAAELLERVLRPIAEQRGLDEWNTLKAYADEEWYPSRLTFGKHKGRSFYDARQDAEVRVWLEWLAESSNPQSAAMGRWYLKALNEPLPTTPERFEVSAVDETNGSQEHFAHGVVVYVDPRVAKLRQLIDAARLHLADLEASYTSEKSRVTALQAVIFKRLRPHFEERDRLRLVVNHRRSYIKMLLSEGAEAAGKVREQFEEAEAQTKQEYEDIGAEMEAKRRLSDDEEAKLKRLWRDLVKLFHPDRYASEPDKQETYTKLTGAINAAKDSGDLETLRKIAADPNAYVMRRGWTAIDLRDNDQPEQLQKLFHSLEAEILAVIESTEALKRSPSFELYQTLEETPEELDNVIAQQISGINEEVEKLKAEAEKLKQEIAELSGDDAPVIG